MSKDDGSVSGDQLAALFDCTPRQIQLYARDKIVVRKGRGRYDAAQSTRNLIRHLRAQAAGRAGVDLSTDTAGANAEQKREQAALTRARRLQLEGKTVEVEQVRRVWAGIMVGLRQMVLGVPGRVAAVVPTLTTHDRKMIVEVCRDVLKDASLGRGLEIGTAEQSVEVSDDDENDEG